MKKSLLVMLSSVAVYSAVILSTGCKKDDDPAPGGNNTTPGVTFSYDANLTNNSFVLTSNRAAAFASGSLGSYYVISEKRTGTNASTSATGADFRYFDTNTSSTGTPAPELRADASTKATKFGTTTLVFETARAGQVDSSAAPASTNITLTPGSTILFQTADGKKGLIKVESLSDAVVASGGSTKNATLSIKVAKKD